MKWRLIVTKIIFHCFFLVAIGHSSKVFAADQTKVGTEPKYNSWGVRFAFTDLHYEGRSPHRLLGQGLNVGISSMRALRSWYLSFGLDIRLGPYATPTQDHTKTDFFGTGLSVCSGIQLLGESLRSEHGGVGIGLLLTYLDVIGRSVGTQKPSEDGRFVTEYELGVRGLFAAPGIFFGRLKPARLNGNAVEDLVTRIEGYLVFIGVERPLFARFNSRYREDNINAKDVNQSREFKERGSLSGFAVILSLSTLLGV